MIIAHVTWFEPGLLRSQGKRWRKSEGRECMCVPGRRVKKGKKGGKGGGGGGGTEPEAQNKRKTVSKWGQGDIQSMQICVRVRMAGNVTYGSSRS